MTNIELISKIKAEIERQKNDAETLRERNICIDILSFLDTLEKSKRPEPYNPVYDEAYLNEKIKKATGSWKGVDVDVMLAECRGYDEEKSGKPMSQDEDLEEEIERIVKCEKEFMNFKFKRQLIGYIARHFAQWGAEHRGSSEIPKDLDEAAEKYQDDHTIQRYAGGRLLAPEFDVMVKEVFIAGAKWMAEHTPLPEDTVLFNKGVSEGKRLMMEEAVSIIESRLSEIIGDAQPKPALRAELEELIKRIKDGKD